MKINDTQETFNFDDWCALAKRDPEAFEAKRRETLEGAINQSPEPMRQRLRALQWRVDMERARAKNPNSSCVSIYRMMWDRVYGEGGLLEALDGLLTATTGSGHSEVAKRANSETKSADVLSFRLSNS